MRGLSKTLIFLLILLRTSFHIFFPIKDVDRFKFQNKNGNGNRRDEIKEGTAFKSFSINFLSNMNPIDHLICATCRHEILGGDQVVYISKVDSFWGKPRAEDER